MSENKKTIYICDGRKWCGSTEGCYLNGGPCSHTKELSHAKNFIEWNKTYEESATKTESVVSSEKSKDTRYAYEWFMREEDKRYWRQTEKLVEKEKKKVIKIMATLTIVSMAIMETTVFVVLRKFSKQ